MVKAPNLRGVTEEAFPVPPPLILFLKMFTTIAITIITPRPMPIAAAALGSSSLKY
jgi:hypothetical protein